MRAKITALILTLVLLFIPILTLSGCDRAYDEAEVIAASRELLADARMLYSVYYGRGINYTNSGYSDGDYKEADAFHLAELGFSTISELKTLSYATFSEKYCENIFEKYLESYEANNTVYNYARYVQVYDGVNYDKPAYILVLSDFDYIFDDRMTYDLDSVKAVRSKGDYVHMTVEVTVENEDGKSQKTEIEFTLFEEKAGWRIASPCFANYNKYLDNELLK